MGAFTGRFIKAELTGGYTYRHKVFIVGSRSYQLVFISKDKGVPPAVLEHHESAAKRFLDSLKLRLLVAQVTHNNGMHPTADTTALMLQQRCGAAGEILC
jgi:hypothetical protein